MEAIIEVAHMRRVIDQHAVDMYKEVPQGCVPELFRETEEEARGECQIAEMVGSGNVEHRKFARERMLQLKNEMILMNTDNPDPVTEAIVQDLETSASEIDISSPEPLVVLPGVSELLTIAAWGMFSEFNNCMKES
ncbi:MAG: hypothetical protein PHN44_01140 [Candidatus Marinimicrobia bacterium]|nr:hypothetical protein [Candidatus Neomarinimicrobiota bacterium]MDD5539102.1 hypothetical protein [Candidatus Neomarinimicrobiota bacterium]